MKFSPTITLALVLAAGMTAAAVAQTAPGTASEPKASVAKPLAGSMPSQPGLNDNKTTSSAQSSAQMKSEAPKAKRIAHAKAMHPKRFAQAKATPAMSGRGARLRHPAMQAEKLTPDQVKGAQQQLQAAGLYNGPTDGMMDPDTRAALARYQQQNGLRRTETLDQKTLARLNTNKTSGVGSSAPGPSSTVAPSGNQSAPTPAGAGGNTTGQPINR